MEKIPATTIYLKKVEGKELPHMLIALEDCGNSQYTLWQGANRILAEWAQNCGESYDQVDFCVTFEDTETYEGTIHVTNPSYGTNETLEGHIINYCMYHAGRKNTFQKRHDTKMSDEAFRKYIIASNGIESVQSFERIMDTYQIGSISIREIVEQKMKEEEGRPALDMYHMILCAADEMEERNDGLLYAYIKEAHAALATIMEMIGGK